MKVNPSRSVRDPDGGWVVIFATFYSCKELCTDALN
jgi:hypothetical protein